MRNLLRWSAVSTATLLVLAACTPAGSGSPSAGESVAESAAASQDAAAICAADEFGCVEVPAGEPIHIVYWGVILGPDGSLGVDSQRGVEIAIDDRGGKLLDRDIQLTAEDAGCTPETGAVAAQKLATDTTIAGLIGPNCTDEVLGGIQAINDAGLTTVSPSATRAGLTVPDRLTDNPSLAAFLRTAHSDYYQGRMVAEYLYTEQGARTLATIHDGSGYAEALVGVTEDHFKELGGTVVGHEAISKTQEDVSGALTPIGTAKPDALYFPVFIEGAGHIAAQAKDTPGLENTLLMSSDGTFSADFVKAAGAAALGQFISSPDTSKFTDAYQDFLAKHQAKYGEAPLSIFHAHAYDAAQMVFAAIEAVAVTDADGTIWIPRKAYRDALYATKDLQGLTGTHTCTPDGDCGALILAVYQVTAREVGPPVVWPPEAPIWAPDPSFYTTP
jgi:branched-chain amino acid transport system substrate-binding protein